MQNGEIERVYALCGNQYELIADAIAQLKTSLLGNETDFDFSLFRGDEAAIGTIIEAAETYPMLSVMRLCVVKDAHKIKGADPAGSIQSYIDSPCPTTCLVLTFDERPKLDLKPSSRALLVDCSVQARELSALVADEAQRLGVKITGAAAELLISFVGDNLGAIRNELNKLGLYIEGGETITPRLVARLTEKTEFVDVFELVNAISDKDKKRAMSALMELEAKREEPLLVLNTLSWRIRLLWRAKEMIERGDSEAEIARALKTSTRALYYIRKQAKNFSYEDFKGMMKELSEGDRSLKMSYAPREHTLTKLILNLCG